MNENNNLQITQKNTESIIVQVSASPKIFPNDFQQNSQLFFSWAIKEVFFL